jgi:hypothetical protein
VDKCVVWLGNDSGNKVEQEFVICSEIQFVLWELGSLFHFTHSQQNCNLDFSLILLQFGR